MIGARVEHRAVPTSIAANSITRAPLTEPVEIGPDNGGDLRVAANRLPGPGERDRLPSPGTWIEPWWMPSEIVSAPAVCSSRGPVGRRPIRSAFVETVYGSLSSSTTAASVKRSACEPQHHAERLVARRLRLGCRQAVAQQHIESVARLADWQPVARTQGTAVEAAEVARQIGAAPPITSGRRCCPRQR